jgi:Nitric oxide synthase, oxygenase domain
VTSTVAPSTELPAQRCPVDHSVAGAPPATTKPVDKEEALDFLELFYSESGAEKPFEQRLREVYAEIDETGSYTQTLEELTFGARVAWRNADRCIGRLYWKSLHVRDFRHVRRPAEVAEGCISHLRECTRGGRIRSTITIFAPDRPGEPGPRIHNDQLIRYAGHRTPTGEIRGDGRYADFTDRVVAMGWKRPDPPGRFDILPLLISVGYGEPELFTIPKEVVLEVPLEHPEHPWFAELKLRWHAVPAISNMPLVIGGITYPCAPFNGWYMGTEIGARNLIDRDRYDLLPVIGKRLGLDMSSDRTLWRDRAMVEVVRAVQHSFDKAGVTMTDHHTESQRFLTHVAKEEKAGRRCPANWSWIVPPVSGGLTPVYHRYYDEPDPDQRPAFLQPGQA